MTRSAKILQALAVAAGLALSVAVGPAAAADPAPGPSAHKDLVLRGDARCTRCHDEGDDYPVLDIGKTRHGVKADARTPTCTSCHGASDAHVDNPKGGDQRPLPDVRFRGKNKSTAEARNAQCLNCHENGQRTLWHGGIHQSEGLACTDCHAIHTPHDNVLTKVTQPDVCFNCHKAQRAESHLFSHHPILEGKVACSDCHNPHGGAGPKNLVKNTVNEVCFQCHAEKRGPFLYEHPPVVDDCMNCHTPHGSVNQPLLKAKGPWLCQDCHAESAPHPGNVYSGALLPGGAAATINRTGPTNPITGAPMTANAPAPQMAFRGCVNCHSQIHGSNHPAGRTFLR